MKIEPTFAEEHLIADLFDLLESSLDKSSALLRYADGTTESLILLPAIYVIAGCLVFICVGDNDMLNLFRFLAGHLEIQLFQYFLASQSSNSTLTLAVSFLFPLSSSLSLPTSPFHTLKRNAVEQVKHCYNQVYRQEPTMAVEWKVAKSRALLGLCRLVCLDI